MNPTSAIVLTATIVALGKWAKDEKLDIKFIVAGGFAAIVLTVLAEVNDKYARAMGMLILIAAVYAYGPLLVKKAGLTK